MPSRRNPRSITTSSLSTATPTYLHKGSGELGGTMECTDGCNVGERGGCCDGKFHGPVSYDNMGTSSPT